MTRKLTLEQACAQYPHRFTLDHVPAWALRRCSNGKFYAPQFASDAEWFANTAFPGEGDIGPREKYCRTSFPTWPRGQWLDAPFKARA